MFPLLNYFIPLKYLFLYTKVTYDSTMSLFCVNLSCKFFVSVPNFAFFLSSLTFSADFSRRFFCNSKINIVKVQRFITTFATILKEGCNNAVLVRLISIFQGSYYLQRTLSFLSRRGHSTKLLW